MLVPRSTPEIEDQAAPTLRADQPFPSACIAEAERAAANRTSSHGSAVPRTERFFTRRGLREYRFLLLWIELRVFVSHAQQP